MSVHPAEAARFSCDGPRCDETVLESLRDARDAAFDLPIGWYELAVPASTGAPRRVFHQPSCLVEYIADLRVRRKDDGGETVSDVGDWMAGR